MLLHNQEITEEIQEEIKIYPETKDNENMVTRNLWNAAKAVLRWKFITIQSYPKKQTISNKQPNLHLKQLESTTTTKKNPKLVEEKKS